MPENKRQLNRRKKDVEKVNMANANFWLKIMTIIMTLSMFGITWIANDISQIKVNVNANYTITQVILTKLTAQRDKLERETKERKEGDKLAKFEREEIRRKFNTHVVDNYQSLNERKYRLK